MWATFISSLNIAIFKVTAYTNILPAWTVHDCELQTEPLHV